jgi:hypothetical protein
MNPRYLSLIGITLLLALALLPATALSEGKSCAVLGGLASIANGGVCASRNATGASVGCHSIQFGQISAAVEKQYSGDGLAVFSTPEGARLHCVFQRMEGEATAEGLWLVSTATNHPGDRFRVVATQVGRGPRPQGPPCAPALANPARGGQRIARPASTLPLSGNVSVQGQSARFTRPT